MAYSLTDLALATMNKLPMNDTDLTTVLSQQQWFMADYFFGDPTQQRTIDAGLSDEYYINEADGTLTYAIPGSERRPELSNSLFTITIPTVNAYYQVAIIEDELKKQGLMGMNPKARVERVINIIKARRQAKMLGALGKMEADAWQLPILTGPAPTYYGFPYHLVPITSAQAATSTASGAFQGDIPALHGGGAGTSWCGKAVSSTAYTNLRSWNATWSGADCLMSAENKIRLARMLRNIKFQKPKMMTDLASPAFDKYRIATDQYMVEQIESAAQAQNDTLGSDILKYFNGGAMVGGIPVDWVPALDTADATSRGVHPLYAINLGKFKIIKRDLFKKRPTATDAVRQPDVAVEYVDFDFNLATMDRRTCGGLISYVA